MNPKRFSQKWVADKFSTNSRGQKSIFLDQYMKEEWEGFQMDIDRYLNVKSEKPVPDEDLQVWLKSRCMVRKSKDDWTGLKALHRDFTEWTGSTYTLSAFETALRNAGFGMRLGMASRLILKVDLQMTLAERYGTIAV